MQYVPPHQLGKSQGTSDGKQCQRSELSLSQQHGQSHLEATSFIYELRTLVLHSPTGPP